LAILSIPSPEAHKEKVIPLTLVRIGELVKILSFAAEVFWEGE